MTLVRTSLLLSPALFFFGCSKPAESSNPYVSAPSAAQPAKLGEATFARVCATCHQPNGAGVPSVFPPLVGSEFVQAQDPSNLVRIVLHGLQGPVTVKGATYQGVMPPQAALLKDEEIAAVLTYIRSAWGHQAGPVSADLVHQIRTQEMRDTLWTIPELPAHGK